VTDGQTQVIAEVPKAHSVLVAPGNEFLLVAALGVDRLFRFDFDAATGRIAAAQPPSVAARAGSGPRHLSLHPRQACLYCINETDGTIDTYAIARAPFTLALRQSVDMRPPGAPPVANARAADIHVTPDGRFLYGSERQHNTIAAFAIDAAAGTLTRIGSYAGEPGARGFAIDPTGRFLVAAGQVSGRVAVHAIDPTRGSLAALGAYDAGPGANWVEIVAREVA
jgi:6-phosphogluconolactonase